MRARRKLTLPLILPAILVPCTLMILLVAVISFGMVYFRSETDRLGRAFAPGVSAGTTLVVTDIQVVTMIHRSHGKDHIRQHPWCSMWLGLWHECSAAMRA
jgi:hypothetical protein